MSPLTYSIKLKAELARVQQNDSSSSSSSTSGGAPAGEAAVVAIESASPHDILAMEAANGSAASAVGIIFDWKVEYLTEQVMVDLFATGKVKAAILSTTTGGAATRRSYTLGKTRPDFQGLIRVFNIVTPSAAPPTTAIAAAAPSLHDRYVDFLHLAIHEMDAAIADNADSFMGFYDLDFKPALFAAGLCEEDKECILLGGGM